MNVQALKTALSDVRSALRNGLGSRLHALYVYGSVVGGYFQAGHSDVNLFLVTDEDVSLPTVYDVLQPVYRRHASLLRIGPAVTTPTALDRQHRFNPGWLHEIGSQGRLLAGAPLLISPPEPDVRMALARDCREALATSAALAPDMLPAEVAQALHSRLQRLTRRLTRQRIDLELPAATLMGTVQKAIGDAMADQPEANWSAPARDDAPPAMPTLRGIYERADELILVLPDLTPERISSTNWPVLAAEGAADYGSMHLTTGGQFQLIGRKADPVSVALGHFSHAWGSDPLEQVRFSSDELRRAAGRVASDLLLIDLPTSYLGATDEEQQHKVIHDVQNRLLNLQLQHELLHRLHGLEAARPEGTLPGREKPLEERVSALRSHLEWWADYYDVDSDD
jgi:hypothetical protein